ncbi:hypothetical protein MHBO_005231, partial [Bonamia ostreae]
MKKIDWNNVNEAQDFQNPTVGGYVAKISYTKDEEIKEYLRIEWDFAEGEFAGNNRGTYERANFWPLAFIRSYKEKALPFFKSFKTAREESNRNYTFREDYLDDMTGKRVGIVLGEEEYEKKDGAVGKRLYVYQTSSVKSIKDGDFKVPDLKKLKNTLSAPLASS